MCTLLDTFEVEAIVSELSVTSDVELLLDFLLHLLRDGNLTNLSVPGANRKARRLMFKLISVTNIVPRSLFITDVKIETHITIGMGSFGRVFRGEHDGKPVALKLVEKGRKENSLLKDFCQEALAWRSLSHRCILPLLGIYEEKSQLYLVSPFMPNDTLNRWRKKHTPPVAKVDRLMLEIAEGMHHLHSEGVVHGDLHAGNVLLDSELHCKIADFGLTRHSETTVAASTRAFSPNFAAPELFGLCTTCGQSGCDGCDEGRGVQHRSKTTKTDVYAFGCLYYAIFFGVAPFHEKNDFQILRLVMVGERPCRLENPKMADGTWNLITSCWISKPSERPTMAEIVEIMKLLSQ
ncbi:kinase-like domain-containing protein [Amanita rubescens]|nr:kinase-like domain-containing protein [Amanita rubescens]